MKTNHSLLFPCVFIVLAALLLPARANPPTPAPAGQSRRLDSPAPTPQGVAPSDWAGIRAAYQAGRLAVRREEDGSLVARNPGQQWRARFDGRGFDIAPEAGGWTWGLELKSYGFPGSERGVGEKAAVSSEAGRVFYDWDAALREWFVNDPRGLEQGWTVRARPDGARAARPRESEAAADEPSALRFTLGTRGRLVPRVRADGAGVSFVDGSGAAVLTYGGLKAWDADGRALPARFEPVPGEPATLRVAVEEYGARYPITVDPIAQQAYVKASNTGANDNFGASVAVSGDTMVVGAPFEDSNATGVNGNQANNSATDSGAAYVFVRSGGIWIQQAYLKATNTGAGDQFGYAVAVAGNTVVVGAPFEDSNATGINGNGSNNTELDSGAAYVFVRSGTTWTQQAYVKASNTEAGDNFGTAVAVSGDTVVVGADRKDNGFPNPDSGSAYVFVRSGTIWSQQDELPASNRDANDRFGASVAVSGNTVVVGAPFEDSNATGVNGNANNDNAPDSGAAYVFVRSGTTWSPPVYIKASNTYPFDGFGTSVAVSGDSVVVGAPFADHAGGAYVFMRSGTTWSQQAYLKASNSGWPDEFGRSVAVSDVTVVVGAHRESSNATGVNGNQTDRSAFESGAAYVFVRYGTNWFQQAYLKASNTGADDEFGTAVAVSGETVVVGAPREDSSATRINGDGANNSLSDSGAAYVFAGFGPAPEIAVQQPIGTDLADGTTTNDFGNVNVGRSSAARTFIVTNAGTADLFLLSITTDGSHPGDFTVSALSATILPPGATATVTVTFAPVALGSRSAALHIANTDADENPFDIALTGTGGTPEISVQQPVGTDLVGTGSVVAWGDDTDFQTTVPTGLTGIQAIAAGGYHTVALSNGIVVAWGRNTDLQTSVPGGLTGVQAIAAGGYHTVALRSNGLVVAWGRGIENQTSVPGSLAGVQAIAAGRYHTVALRSNGTVVAWGRNTDLQTSVPGGLTGVQAIAAGGYHTVALRSNGIVVAWGRGIENQTSVPGGLTGVQAIAAGGYHTVALRSNGTVVAWGDNGSGQTDVPDELTGVQAIAAGGAHTVALKSDRTAIAWGRNSRGQRSAPNGLRGVQAIAAGDAHTVALKIEPPTVAFSNQTVGLPSPAMTFTIINLGTANLVLTNITKDGTNFGDFTVSALDATNLAPGTSTTFTVTFTPAALGSRSAALHIANNDADENTFDIALTGIGVTPEIAVQQPAGTDLADGAASIDFDRQVIGITNLAKIFTVINLGPGILILTNIATEGADANDFRVGTPGLTNLAPGQSTAFTVNFNPTAAGPRSALIRITNNDADENPFDIALTGTGVVIACPADLVVSAAPGQCYATNVAFIAMSASPVSCVPPSGSNFPVGTNTVTCTASNAAGVGACQFTVTVRDVEAPVMICPPDQAFSAPLGAGSVVVNYSPTASDACSSNRPVICMPPSGSAFPVGTNTVVCAATDAAGNSNVCRFTITVAAPAFVEAGGVKLIGVSDGALAWGDFNGDGRPDLFLSGETLTPLVRVTQLQTNVGGTTLSNLNLNLPRLHLNAAAWADYDLDGDLDLVVSGHTNGSLTQLYRNGGNGAFTAVPSGLAALSYSSAAWGDFDHDGRPDLLLSGTPDGEGFVTHLYRNCGDGRFAEVDVGLPGVAAGAAAWADFDNDGTLDLALMGFDGTQDIAGIYRGHGDGTFAEVGELGFGFSEGATAWGDYNNDGYPDVVFTGLSGIQARTVLYRNEADGSGGRRFVAVENSRLPDLSQSAVAWGDFNNDGRLDLVLAGATPLANPARLAGVYLNTGGDQFQATPAGLPAVQAAMVACGDFNADGKLDIVMAGDTGTNKLTRLLLNAGALANTPPSAPDNLAAGLTTNGVTLRWDATTDEQTPPAGLSYNVRIIGPNGRTFVVSPAAMSGGTRLLPAIGNARQTNSWSLGHLALPTGVYTWSVQAIDTAFAGSAFSTNGTFYVEQPVFTAVGLLGDGRYQLQFTGSNLTYNVEATTKLLDRGLSVWTRLGEATTNAPGQYEFNDGPAPSHSQRFYRLVWP